jgi:hypothetical protein
MEFTIVPTISASIASPPTSDPSKPPPPPDKYPVSVLDGTRNIVNFRHPSAVDTEQGRRIVC